MYVTGHSEVDAVHDTVAEVDPTLLAVIPDGTDGTGHVVVVKDPVPAELAPAPLVAMTSIVYAVPELRPVYDTVVSPVDSARPPLRVTVYVTGQSEVEAVQLIVAVVWAKLSAVTPVGGDGNVQGCVANVPVAGLDAPAALLATTSMV